MEVMDAKAVGERNGFDFERSFQLPEIGGSAHIYRHRSSGARLLHLANSDPNKAFSISFKTPATDDTGVFHILEHSVLCGSRKFPVKEPFVTLLKSSMQTFLNAMTFPDKTMYPVASTNEQDLMNLMDVYLDAVFHPNIYENPRIFEQEGWHLEFDGEDGGNLVYNGVVYNEMKGALSDPEQVLYDELCAALYPDTTYRFESGGVPADIPSLTYQGFLDTHEARYAPENSYIILYGDLDPDRFMGFIDREYLAPMAAERPKSALPAIAEQSPLTKMGVKREMATAPDNSCAAFGYVVGCSYDRERIAAMSILLDAVMGSNEAPLKRALLDADIADDCDAYLSDAMLQPFVMVSAKGLHDDAVARMGEVLSTTVAALAGTDGGDPSLDEALVEAAISHSEFSMREYDFGYPDGVMLSMSSMSGWLYDDSPEGAVRYLRYEELFASLRAKLGTGYYPQLLREVFLDNDHRAQVEIVPVDAMPETAQASKLAEMQASMGESQLEAIAEEVDALRAAQMAPDDAESLARLPHLSRADIGDAPAEPAMHPIERDGMRILRHEVDTHGISYMTLYFDVAGVPFEELSYLSVLALLLGKLDTASHSASEMDTLVQSKMGVLQFACEVMKRDDGHEASVRDGELRIVFSITASCLEARTADACALISEILSSTDFGDVKRILDILVQRKVVMEQRFSNAGNSVALARAAAAIDRAHVVGEQLDGIDFYGFLKGLISRLEGDGEHLGDRLQALLDGVIGREGLTLSFGGSDGALDAVASSLALPAGDGVDRGPLAIPQPSGADQAFAVPTDVTYSALVAHRRDLAGNAARFSGSWQVLSRILSFDYLWNEVRVVGGAYGVGFSMGRTGIASFYSYRDPHVAETLERFRLADGWIERFDPSQDEFEGYVVSTAAGFDKPLKPRSLIRRQAVMHLTGYTRERLLGHRQEVVDCTVDDVRALGPAIGKLCESARFCVIGSRAIMEDADIDVDIVELLDRSA